MAKGKSTRRKHRSTHRSMHRKTARSTYRPNPHPKRVHRKKTRATRRSRRSRRSRRGMGIGDKMDRMTLAQQFVLREDLRAAKKVMTREELRTVLKALDEDTKTLEEQLDGLAIIGKPFAKPPKGRWTTDHTKGDKKFWCPHGLTCLTEDECDDFEEHKQSKAYD